MRLLVLLRHAEAATAAGGAIDADRSLTPAGEQDARAAGNWLAQQGCLPDLVVCSAARRARQTWTHAAPVVGGTPVVEYREDVYEATHPDDVLAVIHGVPPTTRVLLVVGHNPVIGTLSASLHPGPPPVHGFRTAGIAVHEVTGEWAKLDASGAAVTAHTTARHRPG